MDANSIVARLLRPAAPADGRPAGRSGAAEVRLRPVAPRSVGEVFLLGGEEIAEGEAGPREDAETERKFDASPEITRAEASSPEPRPRVQPPEIGTKQERGRRAHPREDERDRGEPPPAHEVEASEKLRPRSSEAPASGSLHELRSELAEQRSAPAAGEGAYRTEQPPADPAAPPARAETEPAERRETLEHVDRVLEAVAETEERAEPATEQPATPAVWFPAPEIETRAAAPVMSESPADEEAQSSAPAVEGEPHSARQPALKVETRAPSVEPAAVAKTVDMPAHEARREPGGVSVSIGRIEIIARKPAAPRRTVSRARGHRIDPGRAFRRED